MYIILFSYCLFYDDYKVRHSSKNCAKLQELEDKYQMKRLRNLIKHGFIHMNDFIQLWSTCPNLESFLRGFNIIKREEKLNDSDCDSFLQSVILQPLQNHPHGCIWTIKLTYAIKYYICSDKLLAASNYPFFENTSKQKKPICLDQDGPLLKSKSVTHLRDMDEISPFDIATSENYLDKAVLDLARIGYFRIIYLLITDAGHDIISNSTLESILKLAFRHRKGAEITLKFWETGKFKIVEERDFTLEMATEKRNGLLLVKYLLENVKVRYPKYYLQQILDVLNYRATHYPLVWEDNWGDKLEDRQKHYEGMVEYLNGIVSNYETSYLKQVNVKQNENLMIFVPKNPKPFQYMKRQATEMKNIAVRNFADHLKVQLQA